jgi:hypothetical protein
VMAGGTAHDNLEAGESWGRLERQPRLKAAIPDLTAGEKAMTI